MGRAINWLGLVAGISVFVLLFVSVFLPWWQLTIGSNFIGVYVSPVVTSFEVYGLGFTLPLLWAWNLSNILLFSACGVFMLIYSLFPAKVYSKYLLCFSYKTVLCAFVGFVVGLVVVVGVAGFFGINVPLVGSAVVDFSVPSFIPLGDSLSSLVTATFLGPFFFAIVVVGLCVAARVYHGRLGVA